MLKSPVPTDRMVIALPVPRPESRNKRDSLRCKSRRASSAGLCAARVDRISERGRDSAWSISKVNCVPSKWVLRPMQTAFSKQLLKSVSRSSDLTAAVCKASK